MVQQNGYFNPLPAQSRYGCGHIIQPSDRISDPQLCRGCSWLMLYSVGEFVQKQNEICVEEVKMKLDASCKRYQQARAYGDRELAEEMLDRREELEAGIKQIREAGTRYRQVWADRWTKRYGMPNREELNRRERWQREQYEKERQEEYKERVREEQRKREAHQRRF